MYCSYNLKNRSWVFFKKAFCTRGYKQASQTGVIWLYGNSPWNAIPACSSGKCGKTWISSTVDTNAFRLHGPHASVHSWKGSAPEGSLQYSVQLCLPRIRLSQPIPNDSLFAGHLESCWTNWPKPLSPVPTGYSKGIYEKSWLTARGKYCSRRIALSRGRRGVWLDVRPEARRELAHAIWAP